MDDSRTQKAWIRWPFLKAFSGRTAVRTTAGARRQVLTGCCRHKRRQNCVLDNGMGGHAGIATCMHAHASWMQAACKLCVCMRRTVEQQQLGVIGPGCVRRLEQRVRIDGLRVGRHGGRLARQLGAAEHSAASAATAPVARCCCRTRGQAAPGLLPCGYRDAQRLLAATGPLGSLAGPCTPSLGVISRDLGRLAPPLGPRMC